MHSGVKTDAILYLAFGHQNISNYIIPCILNIILWYLIIYYINENCVKVIISLTHTPFTGLHLSPCTLRARFLYSKQ